jgi:hypothetical protein
MRGDIALGSDASTAAAKYALRFHSRVLLPTTFSVFLAPCSAFRASVCAFFFSLYAFLFSFALTLSASFVAHTIDSPVVR